MSADEDSFIVLEETPSMLDFSLLNTSIINTEDFNKCTTVTVNSQPFVNGIAHNEDDKSLNNADNQDDKVESTTSEISFLTLSTPNVSVLSTHNLPHQKVTEPKLEDTNMETKSKSSLAQSFLLGDINCDKMKSFFPNIDDSSKKEDLDKWNDLFQGQDLKDTFQHTNAPFNQMSMMNSWHSCVNNLKEHHGEELKKCKNINDELFHQNHDIQAKVAELQCLAGMSRKSRNQEDDQLSVIKLEKQELEKMVQSLKRELANIIAMNIEADETHRESIVANEQLNVELIAIQNLYKNASAEIASLKMQNENLRRDNDNASALIKDLCEHKHMIQAQCEIYRTDFELERKQREEMKQERDQMIADIEILKRRNQALIDEAQSYYTETSLNSFTSSASADDKSHPQSFVCPLCSNVYQQLNDLESHVQSCLGAGGGSFKIVFK